MRATLSLIFILFSLTLFGQNENPYKEFGYEAQIMPDNIRALVDPKFKINNTDSASTIGTLVIDVSKRKATFYDKKGVFLYADTLDTHSVSRWLTVDPKGQFSSPYIGMGNNPISGTDPDGGYSKFGAAWRNTFSGGSGIYQSGEDGGRAVWGFNAGGASHFGNDAGSFWKSFNTPMNDQILNRASAMVNAQSNIPSAFITGDGIEPFNIEFDVALAIFTAGAGNAAKAGVSVASKGVQANKIAGNAFRDEIADLLRAEGRTIFTEVPKKTIFGPRVIDIEVHYGGRVLGGIETKVGASRYLPSQRAKDFWLGLNGYPVNLVRKP